MGMLRDLVKKEYDWDLIIYEREWLRLQLEEVHKDIADKYLGIPATFYQNHIMNISTIPTQQENKEIEELISKGKYEDAIPKLKRLMHESSDNEKLHIALAWCYYGIFNYKEALIHIVMALKHNPQSLNSRSIKGCILAEYGIETKSKAKLLSAKGIFSEIVGVRKNWSSFYNLANTLSALGEYEEAKKMYIKSLKENNKAAETWKNLGSCYFHLGNHKKRISMHGCRIIDKSELIGGIN